MKHYLIILFALLTITCKAQQKIENLSEQEDLKYVLANIEDMKLHSLYDGAFYARIYRIYDSKVTTEEDFEGHEILSSVLIVISPDGDYYYPGTKLFKISRLYAPEIISVKETKYPNFVISIKSTPIKGGVNSDKIIEEYVFSGDFFD